MEAGNVLQRSGLAKRDGDREWCCERANDLCAGCQIDLLASRRDHDPSAGRSTDNGALSCAFRAAEDSAHNCTSDRAAADPCRILGRRRLRFKPNFVCPDG